MRLAVLINTCDKFADCWVPFCTLWAQYGMPNSRLYLNTEREDFSFAGLDIVPLNVCTAHGINVDFSRRGFYEGPFGRKEGRVLAYHLCHLRACWVTFRMKFLNFRSMRAR